MTNREFAATIEAIKVEPDEEKRHSLLGGLVDDFGYIEALVCAFPKNELKALKVEGELVLWKSNWWKQVVKR